MKGQGCVVIISFSILKKILLKFLGFKVVNKYFLLIEEKNLRSFFEFIYTPAKGSVFSQLWAQMYPIVFMESS